ASSAASGPRSARRQGASRRPRTAAGRQPEPRRDLQARQEPTRLRERTLRFSWLLLLQEHFVVDRRYDHCSLDEAIAVPETTTLKDLLLPRLQRVQPLLNPLQRLLHRLRPPLHLFPPLLQVLCLHLPLLRLTRL